MNSFLQFKANDEVIPKNSRPQNFTKTNSMLKKVDSYFAKTSTKKTSNNEDDIHERVLTPGLIIQLSAEFQQKLSSYIIVSAQVDGKWTFLFRTETIPNSANPVYIKKHKIFCDIHDYTNQCIKFDVYDGDVNCIQSGYLYASIEIKFLELAKPYDIPIKRNDDILGYLQIHSTLDISTKIIRMVNIS